MMTTEDEPLSPIDAEIEVLLSRLTALDAREPTEAERPIQEVAIAALRRRIRALSRKCTDSVCRVRILTRAEEIAGEDS